MGTHSNKPSHKGAIDWAGIPTLADAGSEKSEVVVQIASAASAEVLGPIGAAPEGDARPLHSGGDDSPLGDEQPFGRFRRRIERFRGPGDADIVPGSLDDESELRLQVMMLREENARLKAARHHPAGAGSAIESIRLLGSQAPDPDTLDEAWSLLSECLVIREGLEQVCVEMQRAIGAVQERLGALTITLDGAAEDGQLSVEGARKARA